MEEIKIIYPTHEDIILINYFNNSVMKNNINKGIFKIDEDSIIITWNENLESEDYFIKNKINLTDKINNEDIFNISSNEEYIYKETKNIYKNNIIIKLHSLNNTFDIILYKNMFKFYNNGNILDFFLGTYSLNRKKITIKWNKDKFVEEFKKNNNFLNFNEEEIYIKNENNEFYIIENKNNDYNSTNNNNNNNKENITTEVYLVHEDWEGSCYINNSIIIKKNKYKEDDIATYTLNDNLLTIKWDNYDPEDFILNHSENKYYLKNISEEDIYLIYSEKDNNTNILKNNNFILNKIDKNIYEYDIQNKKKKYKGSFDIIDNILVINWDNDNIDNFNLNEKTEYDGYYSEYILNNLFEKICVKDNDTIIDKYKIFLLNKNNSRLFFYNKINILVFDYLKIDDEFILIYFLNEIPINNNKVLFDEKLKFIEEKNEQIISNNINNLNKPPEYLYKIYKFNYDKIKYYIHVTDNYLEEIKIEHKDWKDICIINKYLKILYRKNYITEYGNYILNENKLIIYWNKWTEEVFINNNEIYYYDNYLTNNINSISNTLINNHIDNDKIKEIKLENNKSHNNSIISNEIKELENNKYEDNTIFRDEIKKIEEIQEIKNKQETDKKIKYSSTIILNKNVSELDNKKIFIYHLDWNDECIIKNNYIYRKSNENEYGKFFYKKNKLIIYWEKWDKDLFFFIENKFYSQKVLKYLNLYEKNYIINIFLNKIYQEINENYIFIASFNYIYDKISILWETDTENNDYLYDSDIFYLDIEESDNRIYSYKFDIIILKDQNTLNDNFDDNSSNSDISYYDINFNEIIEYNEELNEIYVKDYNDDYKNYKKYNDEYNIYNKDFTTNKNSLEYSENYKTPNNLNKYRVESNEELYDLNKSISSKIFHRFFESYNYIINNFTQNDLDKIIKELDIYLIPNDIITILVFYSIIFFIKKD